jgi:hypothetical protein
LTGGKAIPTNNKIASEAMTSEMRVALVDICGSSSRTSLTRARSAVSPSSSSVPFVLRLVRGDYFRYAAGRNHIGPPTIR